MKRVRLTRHAKEQCEDRGATQEEVEIAISDGYREIAKLGRFLCRYNFRYADVWQEHYYSVKQVAPVIKEEAEEIVVITVYTFYF